VGRAGARSGRGPDPLPLLDGEVDVVEDVEEVAQDAFDADLVLRASSISIAIGHVVPRGADGFDDAFTEVEGPAAEAVMVCWQRRPSPCGTRPVRGLIAPVRAGA
jgi:hypothetical protein